MFRLDSKLISWGAKILKKSRVFVPFFVVIIVLAALFTISNRTEVNVLGAKIETLHNKSAVIPTPTTKKTPTITKVSSNILTATVTPTATPVPQTVIVAPTSVPAASTNTPTPATSGAYVVDGASFSSLYPTVSLKPGDTAVAFSITSTGTKTFTIYDARVIGVDGVTFSPMSGSINPGEKKDILITVDPNAKPGTYGGFIGIKVDSGYPSQKLAITVTIQGGDPATTPSITVTGPAGGSTYNQGDNVTITWDAHNISGNYEVSVSGDSGSPLTFANVDNNVHSYTWQATKFFAPNASHFRFTVTGGGIVSHADSEIIIN